jgi:glycosyltransferase involved in cell wall biosynthesis
MENWDEVWRRNQFLVAGLARRNPAMKILFVGLPRNVTAALRGGTRRPAPSAVVRAVPGLPNVTVTRPLKLFPDSLPPTRRLNEALFRGHVRRAAGAAGVRNPVLWLNPHYAEHLVGKVGERAVLYDITDDWTTLTQPSRVRRLIVRQDRRLCARADAVIVCSQRLLELKREMASRLYLIRNGVDAAHYGVVLDGSGPLPPEAARWPKPVLGYTGTLHPDRLDVGLVEATARRRPGASFVLIGPNYLRGSDISRLRACGNVHLVGPVPYARLPQFMRAFDVCIAPHLVTPFTDSLDPIKLWEYLAAGKPSVCTDVGGFRDYPQFVRVAGDASQFVSAIDDALREGPGLAEARRKEAQRNSWEARLDQVESVIDTCLAQRAGKAEHA